MCVSTVWVSYSISSTGLSAPIGHQACVSYTLKQWRTPRILIQEVLASVLCVYVCVCLRTSVCMCSQQSGGGGGGLLCGEVWCDGECWDWSMCAFECDSAHYEGITTLCVCLCSCVCLCASFCVCVPWTQSEVNQYWQWIISSGRVAGGLDGADLTYQQGKKNIYVRAHMHVQIQPVS